MLTTALALLCGGCLVGPDFSSPSAPVADKWLESRDPSVKSASLIIPPNREDWAWWTVFHDPVLDRLIRTAYEQNLSLVSAGTRVLQARAELGVAIGEFFPQVQHAAGSMLYDRPSHADPTANPLTGFLPNFWRDSLGLTVTGSWTFGASSVAASNSADAAYLASIAGYDEVLVTLLGDVATTYIGIRTLETQIKIAEENVAKQKKAVTIAWAKYRGGTATKLDVYQSENVLGQTEAAIPQLTI